ncbi:hypothetical protein BPY_07270 [Bifidobacterium psychraerophilum]|uniref:Septum formation initiator n=2 Tax=Bifidobacterium psychraerophilum TaxID=218140 RepID=A0A087CDH5_9BIFI|nr:Septum formation initiator [Bifidobacterium psychraerophilum]PKA95668.1 cell division protein FtsB [Bifidobacterium psychraerophilum DSM 22366]
MSMATTTAPEQGKKSATSSKRGTAGPISFFVAMIIIVLASIELVSTFHTYALNLSELNSLRKQEASLIAQKQELENNIARWSDNAYVTAQARDRLGFVFPGEQAIRVLHPEAVTGTADNSKKSNDSGSTTQSDLPWYRDMAESFEKADKGTTKQSQKSSAATSDSDAQDTK